MNKSVLYILRRFGFYLIAAFAALTLNFIIPRLMPGDPASIIFARFKGKLKPEAINAMRESFGLQNRLGDACAEGFEVEALRDLAQ